MGASRSQLEAAAIANQDRKPERNYPARNEIPNPSLTRYAISGIFKKSCALKGRGHKAMHRLYLLAELRVDSRRVTHYLGEI